MPYGHPKVNGFTWPGLGGQHTDWVLSTQPPRWVQVLEAVAHILRLVVQRQWIGLVHSCEVGARVICVFKFHVATATVLPPQYVP